MDTATAPTGSVIASAVIKESIARKWTVLTQPVPVTVSAPKVLASVRKDGKARIAVKWTRKHCSVYRTAADMGTLISRRRPAYASLCGLAMTVRKVIREDRYLVGRGFR